MAKDAILIIEDDADITELIEYNLGREGFSVRSAHSGEAGLNLALRCAPDLILLDLMLPGVPGFEVCRQLRRQEGERKIPIIMLTAKSEEADVVAGLELGADDYITKPFSIRELVARVHAVLRRARGEKDTGLDRLSRGPLMIDPERHEVLLRGNAIELTLAEYRLLYALASRPGRVYSRTQLVRRITTGGYHISERNVDVHVVALRRKLRDAGDMIVTIRGVGYKFRGSSGRRPV